MQFEDNRLETVSQAVLGAGKIEVTEESNLKGKKKIEALLRTYREDPETFCRYSLRDAVLVIDILEETGLMDLTIRRAQLTGIGLARAWTSVASFEHLYIASMHRHGFVAPTHGVDAFEVKTAPGGAIIAPQPGLYKNVLVFDFKSLYPSIMRTFNVDPVGYVSPQARMTGLDLSNLIKAPNEVYFRRDQAILPGILESFYEKREDAKAKGDPVASYVYKIIMNSFYGVLGTSGCRFAASDIAGAITSFGQHFLTWCQSRLEARGNRVIYGDTDSLFVLLGPSSATEVTGLVAAGKGIAEDLNQEISSYVRETWNVDSKLELEFEGIYLRFFMPPIRGGGGPSGSNAVRGRAKGYAGLKFTGIVNDVIQSDFEIKGMEAVRRDWTVAAKKLQVDLLKMAFHDASLQDIRRYIRTFIEDVRTGVYDEDLVYKKALRKPVSAYTKSKPPHVKAALELDPEERRGVIEYVWTEAGPEPAEKRSNRIDYDHYIEKQLKPVASALSLTLQADLDSLFKDDKQADLF
jgi:DNA polymerase-2